jgi:uncharacterized membrane protein (Fun14 family)
MYMPRWHKGVLGAALGVLLIGWGHLGYRAIASGNSNSAGGVQNAPATQPSASPLGAWSRRLGASVLVGFLVGWIFRAFVKIMASITALVLSAILLLSYFHIMNVDLTAAETKYKDTSGWVTGQAGKLRAAAMGHVHSTLGGALGLFMGVRKKSHPL